MNSPRTSAATSVLTGAVRLCAEPDLLADAGAGVRRGLLTNYTGVMPDLTRNIEALQSSGVALSALFSPEHGLWGSAQAGESEAEGVDEASGLPVFDTYRKKGDALTALLRRSAVDEILVDLQDCGARFYTYIWSLFDLMVAAVPADVRIVVLDRPNPLAAWGPHGPGLDPQFSSFVGRASIPLIHGMTLGELALRFNAIDVPELTGRQTALTVISMQGWDQACSPLDAVTPWVAPSPNLPTPQSVLAYPGTCLFEGTNVSEGRGTTQPFLTVGAGWVDGRLIGALHELPWPGVAFREVQFVPMFSKWTGERVRGVQLHISDPVEFQPLRTGVELLKTLAALYPEDFRFLEPSSANGVHAIDRLWGSDVLRTQTGRTYEQLVDDSPQPQGCDLDLGLYP